MDSYVKIATDRETGEIEIEVKLLPSERIELLQIRHYIVEKITEIVDPDIKKVTFKWT